MFPFRRYLITLGIMVAVAATLRIVWGISSGLSLAALLVAWPLVGTLITIDDDSRGGWSNPDGTTVPEWKTLWWWTDKLLVRGAIIALAFFVEDAIQGHIAYELAALAIVMSAVGIPLLVRGVKRDIGHAA